MVKLSVVIVSYKVRAYVEQCLASLLRSLRDIDAEVFVVDNNSHDGTVQLIRSRFPQVKVMDSSHNLGFARANNAAIRQSSGEYVLLLNPDTIVAEDTIRCVLDFMDAHPNAGSTGVAMQCADGSLAPESRRGRPSPMTAFYKMCGLCAMFPHSRFGRYYMGGMSWSEAGRIDVVSGAFCMMRRSVLDRVGLLDEDFFMYGEDIDLSCRIADAGYENWYIPAHILHYKGESSHQSSFRYVHVFYNAMLIFFRKHYGSVSHLVALPIKAAILLKATIALFSMQMRAIRRALGFVDPQRMRRAAYIFICTKDSESKCRDIALRNALEATFVVSDCLERPNGHACMALPDAHKVYVVYDTDAFGFGQVLRLFRENRRKGVSMGTFSSKTGNVITYEEVLS